MHIVLFDIDGTLLNSGGAGKAAIETALAEDFGVAIRVSVPYSGRTDRAIGRDLLSMHDVDPSDANWRRLVRGYLARLPACLDRHQGSILPGIAALLATLLDRDDVALGLLTGNIREGAEAKLGFFDLYRHFSFGGFGDRHFDRDDVAREALAEIHAHFNGWARMDRVWVVGDTPLDVRCARAIGARAVAVATGVHSPAQLAATEPDLLLDNLSDPEPLLSVLEGP
jgi:phosphoglycolate phosphatase